MIPAEACSARFSASPSNPEVTIYRPLLALLLGFAAALGAEERIEVQAGAANPMQFIGAGARPAALGSAFTAVGGDLSALYFNPAGLGNMRGSRVGFHHHSWLGGINQETLSFGIGGKALSFGITGDLINYGTFEGTDEFGKPTSSFNPMDMTVGVVLARGFENGLCFGARARVTQQNIQDAGQLVSAGDVGAMWHLPDTGFSMGLSYSNFGSAVNGFGPSAALRLGLAYDIMLSPDYGVLLLASANGLNNGGEQIQAGAELRLSKNFAARAGYQASIMDQGYAGLFGISGGLGAKFGFFGLDYAYSPYGRVGNAHRLSINIDFFTGSEVPQSRPTEVKAPQPKPAERVFGEAENRPKPPSSVATTVQKAPPGGSVDMVFEVPSYKSDNSPSEADLIALTKQNPRNAYAWHSLGLLYHRRGDKKAMISAFDRVMILQPNNRELKKWLEKVKGME